MNEGSNRYLAQGSKYISRDVCMRELHFNSRFRAQFWDAFRDCVLCGVVVVAGERFQVIKDWKL